MILVLSIASEILIINVFPVRLKLLGTEPMMLVILICNCKNKS